MNLRRLCFRLPLLLLLSGIPLARPARAGMESFTIQDPVHRDTVYFELDAPLEEVVGISQDPYGEVVLDRQDASKSRAWFVVPLDSLTTDLAGRDISMRYALGASQYPEARFVLKQVLSADPATLRDQKPVTLRALGEFTVHGVTRPCTITATVEYFAQSADTDTKLDGGGDELRVHATFPVPLKDYGIQSTAMPLMVGEVAKVTADLCGYSKLKYQKPSKKP